MGSVSLTHEPNAIECTKDVRDGKVSDRYLAPAISRFAIEILANVATEADMDQQAKDVRRKLVNLYQRWGKVHKIPDNEDIRAQACNEAKASSRFTRIVQRKNLPWEKDSIARVTHDPEHIPFLFLKEQIKDIIIRLQCSGYGRMALPLSRADSESGKWERVPPSCHKVIVVAKRTLSQSMDVGRTHNVHREWL